MADKGPWPELVEACLKGSRDTYSQARRWQDGYSDCSSWIGKGMKRLGKNPGGSTTLTFLSSSDWATISRDKIGAGDIAVNTAHCVVVTGSKGAVGQQRPGRNVQLGTIDDLMSGTGTYIFRRYKGGTDASFAGWNGDDMGSGVQQAGFTEIPGAIVDTVKWLADTKNWYRIGMVFAGVALIWMTMLSMAKSSKAIGAVTGAVTGAVKATGKAVKKSGGKA